jgi:hypothetical protein
VNKKHLTNTSANAQRKRLLEALQKLGAVTTVYARDRLNIMAPAPRIKELREQGHKIHTDRINIIDSNGCAHGNVARYVLIKLAGGVHAAL